MIESGSLSSALSAKTSGYNHAVLAEAREKVGGYLKNNPNATKADIIATVKAHRDEIRQRVVKLLGPEQLGKWDSAITKGKEFLGQKIEA